MSVRHRAIAGAPERSASEAAGVVVDMVSETLAAATAIESDAVSRELDVATAPIRMLVAGKHLDSEPLVLVAGQLRLEITVVTGNKAIGLEEKLGKAPGAATAEGWSLHLPAPEPIRKWVTEAVEGCEHVTTESPPTATAAAETRAVKVRAIDVDALRRAAGGGSR